MADPNAAIAAALTMAGTGIATAWAEKVVGGATVGAMAENKGLFVRVYQTGLGKLVGLAESGALLRSRLEANRSEWQGGRVFCNAKDAEVVRSIVGANFGGTIECVGGVVIESNDGTRRTDLRFETILSDIWRDSIKEVADALWPPQ